MYASPYHVVRLCTEFKNSVAGNEQEQVTREVHQHACMYPKLKTRSKALYLHLSKYDIKACERIADEHQ